MTKTYAKAVKFKGEPCIKLKASKYEALIAPGCGCSVWRLQDLKNKMELINYNYHIPIKYLRAGCLVAGIPTLLYPNRLVNGKLKTSDANYDFPINEKGTNNHLHGFIHTRPFNIVYIDFDEKNDEASLCCEYRYTSKDEFYQYFPVDFTLTLTFTLSNKGLEYKLDLTNDSDKMLPVGLGCHTTFKAPYARNLSKEDLRIQFNANKRCEIIDNICTGNYLELSDYDMNYINGNMKCVLQNIDNEMYSIDYITNDELKNFHGAIISNIKDNRKIFYEFSEKYPYLNLWNCGGNTSFFCVEPMNWLINAPNIDKATKDTGYVEISPNNNYSVWQKIYSN